MFSQEMEALIQATLEDGMLEEKEKAALVKRAQKEGIDLNELEIYINSILQKRQRELYKDKEARKEKYEQAQKEAFGRKCPNCGAQVPPLTLKCECGYEFTSANSVSSVQIFSDKLQAISSQYNDTEKRNQQIRSLITGFPVPNTKEDIIEFLSLSAPYSKTKAGLWGTIHGRIVIVCACFFFLFLISSLFAPGNFGENFIELVLCSGTIIVVPICIILSGIDNETLNWNKNAKVWKSKFLQILMKGRSLRGDADFQRQLDYYENLMKMK